MVSDKQLIDRLREFLKISDLTTTTTAIVRRKLEEDFNVDLSDKKAFIREQVDLFLQSQLENENEAADEEGEEEEEQEEKRGITRESDGEDEEEDGKKCRAGSNDGGSRKGVVTKKTGGSGFSKSCALSPQLQKVLGATALPRTEVVKQLWVYIRENNLQDPNNRRNILCDKKLRSIFDVDSINMFQMNKVLSKHIHPLDSDNGPIKSIQKDKQRKQERREGLDESTPKEKRRKGGSSGPSGFLAPLPLSNALVKFIGTGESKLPRSEVVKRMWNYIKENKLQVISYCENGTKEKNHAGSWNPEDYFYLWWLTSPYSLSEKHKANQYKCHYILNPKDCFSPAPLTQLPKDPNDKRTIICDKKLKELFEVDSFNGFTATKLLGPHMGKKTEQSE